MYLLCWSNEKEEGWDTFDFESQVQERVYELIKNKGCSPEDMMIFNYGDNYVVPEPNGEVFLD